MKTKPTDLPFIGHLFNRDLNSEIMHAHEKDKSKEKNLEANQRLQQLRVHQGAFRILRAMSRATDLRTPCNGFDGSLYRYPACLPGYGFNSVGC